MTEATARPWHSDELDDGGILDDTDMVVGRSARYHALIVKAVNHHDALVSALEMVLQQYELFTGETDEISKDVKQQARSILEQVKKV